MLITSRFKRGSSGAPPRARFLTVIALGLAAVITTATAAAESKNPTYPEGKVILYNFQNTGKAGEFGYYSYIIPDSIATELRRSKMYEVRSFPVIFEYVDPSAPEEVYKNRIRLLADRGKEFSADFVVTGSYYVENRTIFIKTQIFDVHDQKIKDIHETSEELGAMLLVIIDRLSEKINTELRKGVAVKVARTASSPYASLYNAFNGFSFGASIGMVNIYGPWGDIYDRTESTSLYAGYDLAASDFAKDIPVLRDTELLLRYDYMTANTRDSDEPVESIFTLRSFSLNATYLYRMESFFALTAGAGAGLAISLVEIPGADVNGPPEILDSRRSYDPCVNLAVGARFVFSRIEFGAGFAYHHIFFADRGMDYTLGYFSVGYRL
jgi:TolB-like protein